MGAGVQAIAPALALNEPAGHGVAEVAPLPGTYEPDGAGVHGVWPVALNEPAGHGVATGVNALENSEVSPTASVAVAVRFGPDRAPGNDQAPLPSASTDP